ncbi:hypothetical protein EON77_04350, partial [bacterium]
MIHSHDGAPARLASSASRSLPVRPSRARRAWLAVAPALLFAAACAPSPEGSATDPASLERTARASSAVERAGQGACAYGDATCTRPGPRELRNLFAGYAKARDGLSTDDVQKLVYLPTDAMVDLDLPAAGGADPAASYEDRFRDVLPSALYEHGLRTPLRPASDLDAPFAKGPVTIVVLPGIFGEFIGHSPYDHLFAEPDTRLDDAFRDALARAPEDKRTDTAYRLASLRDEARGLEELVEVSSLDDARGEARVNLVLLKAMEGSLETVGTLQESADVYLRRLTRYFDVMGVPERFYVAGYSRGALVALDLAARADADPARYPWAASLGGVVSLGGPFYGSPLADAAFDTSRPFARIVARFGELAESLEPCADGDAMPARALKVMRNTARWADASLAIAKATSELPKHPEVDWEDVRTGAPDVASITALLKRLLTSELVRLNRPFSGYCANVDRFRVLTGALTRGARSLTSDVTLGWFRENVFPSRMKVFSLTATMGDPSTSEAHVWPLTKNALAYDASSLDYRFLRNSYYDMYDASGAALNDSQTIFARTRVWPAVQRALNPRQPPIAHFYL